MSIQSSVRSGDIVSQDSQQSKRTEVLQAETVTTHVHLECQES